MAYRTDMPRWKTLRAREMRKRPTNAEKLLWALIRRHQLNGIKFRRQAPMLGYIADFFAPQYGVVIEVDGEIHGEQKAYDRRRDRAMTGMGIKVLRFANEVIEADPAKALREILAACGGVQ